MNLANTKANPEIVQHVIFRKSPMSILAETHNYRPLECYVSICDAPEPSMVLRLPNHRDSLGHKSTNGQRTRMDRVRRPLICRGIPGSRQSVGRMKSNSPRQTRRAKRPTVVMVDSVESLRIQRGIVHGNCLTTRTMSVLPRLCASSLSALTRIRYCCLVPLIAGP